MSMSLLNWVKQAKPPSIPGLPDPRKSNTRTEAEATQAANTIVEKFLNEEFEDPQSASGSRKRKRGQYQTYDEETRAKIAKSAIEIGVTKTAVKFSTPHRKLNESTVRSMRDSYKKLKSKNQLQTVVTLPKQPRGAPLLLGEHDAKVVDWVRNVRMLGGVINKRIVMAAAQGIMQKFARNRLVQNGGHITITQAWAKSFLQRLGFTKRKGTKAVKKLPTDFATMTAFIERVKAVTDEHSVPPELVLNWDQTGCSVVPGGDWTMEERGSRQVKITGLDDKRQITALLSVTMSGQMLPVQLIYAGKTDRCHPSIDFPAKWDITHTESHWSTAESMLRYVDNVITPYVKEQRTSLELDDKQKAIAIFDVYKAHRNEQLLQKLANADIVPIFVPAACTDELQPLDLSVNYTFKNELKTEFHVWYSNEIANQLSAIEDETGEADLSKVNVNLRTSNLKPLHARWIVNAADRIAQQPELIISGFKKAGLC